MSNNPLAFASIHATILSIIIAFTSAYIIYKYQLTQQIEMQAIQEAERINKLYFPAISHIPADNDFELPANIEEVRLAISRVSVMAAKDLTQAAIDGLKIPSDPKDRAKEIVVLLNIIGHRYPFPEAIQKTENGWLQGMQEPIRFDNIISVQKWSDDMEHIQRELSMFPLLINMLGYPSEILCTVPSDIVSEKLGFITDAGVILKSFLEYTSQCTNIAYNTKLLLKKAKIMKSLHLPKLKIIVLLLITAMVFLCSVGLPILIESTPKVLYTYVPLCYYFLVFLVVLHEIVSN